VTAHASGNTRPNCVANIDLLGQSDRMIDASSNQVIFQAHEHSVPSTYDLTNSSLKAFLKIFPTLVLGNSCLK
jgi:hypothetical protein